MYESILYRAQATIFRSMARGGFKMRRTSERGGAKELSGSLKVLLRTQSAKKYLTDIHNALSLHS
jgi:hypothetical protein